MNGKQLKNSILQWAIQGKLVPQDPNDEPASVLLEKIRAEKKRLVKEKKIKKDKNESIIFRGDDNSYYEKFLATGEVKCIDEEIPFEIPQGWSVCRLNDLAVYRKGPFGSSLTKSMFVPKSDTSIKVYEQKNAIQKNYELGEYYISKEKYEMMQSFIVEPSDIIVSCAGTIGETYQLPSTAPIGIINQALMRVKLYNLGIAKYWEMYFRYILLNEAEMKGAGSAIKNIPPFEYLKAIIVAIPPMAEQKRIIDRYLQLSALSDKFDVLQKELNNLNSAIFPFIKKSILQEAIQGKLVPQITEEGTAQELFELIKAEKLKLVKEGKLKKPALTDSIIYKGDDNKYYEKIGKNITDITTDIPFEIPQNWQWARLGDIVMINPRNSIDDKVEVGFIPMASIEAGYKNKFSYTYRKWEDVKSGFTHLADDDVAFAKITPCFQNRKSMILNNLPNGYAVGTTELNVLRPYNKTIIAEYLLWFCKSAYFVEEAIMKGTAGQQRVKVDYTPSKLFPLPPMGEQKRITIRIRQLLKILK